MPKVQKVATLNERSVQQVARGEHRRRRGRSPARQQSAVDVRQLDGRVLAEIKRAGVPMRHVQILSETAVVVWNHPPPWPR